MELIDEIILSVEKYCTDLEAVRNILFITFDGYDIQKKQRELTVYEPSCGAGGNIIAMLQCLKKNGINYQKDCDIVCQDLDYRCVYMCYVQLSFLGAKALVVQGNTLMEPFHPAKTKRANIFITPGKAGALL